MKKRCYRCSKVLDESYFYKHLGHNDGLDSNCIECTRKQTFKIDKICRNCKKLFKGRESSNFCSKECNGVYYKGDTPQGSDKKKREAWDKCQKLIKLKPLLKPKACPACKKEVDVIAHHDDYSKWSIVRWMCRECHLRVHKGFEVDSPEIALSL